MRRWAGALAVGWVVALSSCMPDGLPRSLSSSDRATVYEAVYVHKEAVKLYEQGRLEDAIAVAEKAIELLEDKLGATHVALAVPVRSLAVFYQAQGNYAAAEPLYLRAIALQEKTLGGFDLAMAQPLEELASLYMRWGAYDKAEPLYGRALAIRQRRPGSGGREAIDDLSGLALAYVKQGAYWKAEPLYLHALALAEQLGPQHPEVARGLSGLAMLYSAQGTYAQAEPLLVRALEIRRHAVAEIVRVGPVNLPKLMNIFNPSLWRAGRKNTRASRAAGRAADAIVELNSYAVDSLSNLDELYSATPSPEKEPMQVRTADVFEMVLDSARTEVARSMDDLALVYVASGDDARAAPLLARAPEPPAKALGPTSPDVSASLNNLAQLYLARRDYAKAEPLLVRVRELRERTLGPTHPDVALSLSNLASLYTMRGADAQAEPLLVRALAILEKSLGTSHPDVARSLNNLAVLYHNRGAYEQAAPLYRRAVDIMSNVLGGKHPDAVPYLNNLAALYHATGASSDAESLAARATEIRDSQLQLELTRLSAPRKRALMMLVQQETESLVSLHADSTPHSARAFELALTTVLRRKGLALESLLGNQAVLRAQRTPEIAAKLAQRTALSAELAAAVHAPSAELAAAAHAPSAMPADARASAILALRARIDAVESELNAASIELHAPSRPVTLASVQAALPYGAALIEIVRYHRFDPRQDRHRWNEARYVAYIVQRRAPPQWVELGEAAAIDAGVDAVLAEMKHGSGAASTKDALQRLDALVFGPLHDPLNGVAHIIISPDSKLSLVPFEALVDPQGRYELEHRLVSYVTSGRDLLASATRRPPRAPATIVAAPDYGAGRSFAELQSARAEALEVAAHFAGARLLTGPQATKAAFTAIVGPAVLHVATHGFFARPDGAALQPMIDGWARGMFVEGVLAQPGATMDDPAEALDRAGLALANANSHAGGIVTAREIANYDWWGTQLVVLSACETGVGAVPSSDGVYGLRRALALAGAESQIVSLWNVSDASAHALMRAFYDELARGTARAEALRRAKLRMLQQPRFSHPYYWAAFIPAGAWTPLARGTMLP